MPFDHAIQQIQLIAQRCVTMFRQAVDQILNHSTQAPRNLDMTDTAMAYFGKCQMHEVIPVRSPKNQANPPRTIMYLIVVQVPLAGQAQKAMKLVYGENCGSRVVDRR